MQGLTIHRAVVRTFHHELVIGVRLVILAQVVVLYDVDQALRIAGIRGIACSLQSLGPSFVVSNLQREQTAIALSCGQEA